MGPKVSLQFKKIVENEKGTQFKWLIALFGTHCSIMWRNKIVDLIPTPAISEEWKYMFFCFESQTHKGHKFLSDLETI